MTDPNPVIVLLYQARFQKMVRREERKEKKGGGMRAHHEIYSGPSCTSIPRFLVAALKARGGKKKKKGTVTVGGSVTPLGVTSLK